MLIGLYRCLETPWTAFHCLIVPLLLEINSPLNTLPASPLHLKFVLDYGVAYVMLAQKLILTTPWTLDMENSEHKNQISFSVWEEMLIPPSCIWSYFKQNNSLAGNSISVSIYWGSYTVCSLKRFGRSTVTDVMRTHSVTLGQSTLHQG